MLPTNDLSMLKTVSAATLTESAEVWRAADVDDQMGGITELPKTKIYSTSARIAAVGRDPAEKIIAEKIGGSVPYVIWLPITLTILIGDEIRVGSRIFIVYGTINRTNATLLRAVCTEAQ